MLKKDLAENEPEPSPADSAVAQLRPFSSANRLPSPSCLHGSAARVQRSPACLHGNAMSARRAAAEGQQDEPDIRRTSASALPHCTWTPGNVTAALSGLALATGLRLSLRLQAGVCHRRHTHPARRAAPLTRLTASCSLRTHPMRWPR